LFAGVEAEPTQFDERLVRVAASWQRIGDDANFQEMLAVSFGAQPNRMFELVGRIASAGEQLTLAGAAFRDASAWKFPHPNPAHAAVAARALAEITAYYALSAAHGLVNSTARLFALERRSRDAFKAAKGQPNDGFPPFGEKPGHWLPFNSKSVDLIASSTPHQPSADGIVAILRSLEKDRRWRKLTTRRHTDFHRWRPQSTGDGVAPANPWIELDDGLAALPSFGSNVYDPIPASELVEEAGAGLDALVDHMQTWVEIYPVVKDEVTTFVLAANHGHTL
jgi:hypothetical protein